jgi:N-acetylglucosaminyl-diphospho-decaprenol L-rhamnosyltransferase
MPKRPLVDVGIVTWNTAELTVKGVRHLLDTDQGCDLRILVRDNASSDGTPDTLAEGVPEAEIDAGTHNLGFAAGVNTLIARSSAPWLFLLNSDAWPQPGAIGALVRAAESNPRAAAVVPRIEYPSGRLQHSTHPFPSLRVAATVAFAWNRIPRRKADELMLEGAWKHDRPRRVDWAIGAAMLLRRSALETVGGFDERFFFYAEDLEWCWRARKHGLDVWFEPTAVVHHVRSASGDQLYGGKRTRAHFHNALRFYRSEHGTVKAAAWWGLNMIGSALQLAGALVRRDRALARRWAQRTLAQAQAPFAREHGPALR